MKSVKFIIRLFVFFFVLIPFVVQSTVFAIAPIVKTTENILYAKPVSTGTGDCTTWSNACELRVALEDAEADQIWVAAGIHLPTISTNRELSFQLKSGVAIYGGFPADGGTWESRDWENNITILSGDIGTSGDNSDNSYHVVYATDVNSTSILDGFTISGGNANGSNPLDRGGGMYSFKATAILTNNTFSNNTATSGGGLYGTYSNQTISNVIFTNNSAVYGGGLNSYQSSPALIDVFFSNNLSTAYGGAIYGNQSNSTLTNVSFINNSAGQTAGGGGIYGYQSNTTMDNVVFSGNSAGWGGAIFGNESSPFIINTTFQNNSAKYGGAIYNSSASNPTITNSTFNNNSSIFDGGAITNTSSSPLFINVTLSNNSSGNGGAIFNNVSLPTLKNVTIYGNTASSYGGGINNTNNSHSIITNTIIWGNTALDGLQIYNNLSTPIVTFSDIQGSYSGDGNIDQDPLLDILSDNGGLTQTHALQQDSPAIDTGNPDPTTCPATDQRGYYRPIDGDSDGTARCDIGAYEYGSLIMLYIYLPLVQK